MTSPIGKILLAKLPKDIIQFCIEPYLMINEEEVRKNHYRVMNTFHKHDPDNYRIIIATHDPQTRLVTSVVIPHRHVAGDRLWRTKVFYKEREQRKKDLEQKKWLEWRRERTLKGKSYCTIL